MEQPHPDVLRRLKEIRQRCNFYAEDLTSGERKHLRNDEGMAQHSLQDVSTDFHAALSAQPCRAAADTVVNMMPNPRGPGSQQEELPQPPLLHIDETTLAMYAHGSSLDETSRRLFRSTFTSIGDFVTTLLHCPSMTHHTRIAAHLHVLAIHIHKLSSWSVCPPSSFREIVELLVELDTLASVVPSAVIDERSEGEESSSTSQHARRAGRTSNVLLPPGHANSSCDDIMDRCGDVSDCRLGCMEHTLRRLLSAIHDASKYRNVSRVDTMCELFHKLLALDHYEDGRTSLWFTVLCTALTATYVVVEAEALGGADALGRLLVPATMLIAPVAAAVLCRILLPRSWLVYHQGLAVRLPALITSLAIGLAVGARGRIDDASTRRATGVLLTYVMCLWRVTGTAFLCIAAAVLFVLGTLLSLRDSYNDALYVLFLYIGTLCAATAAAFVLLRRSPVVPFGTLWCSHSLANQLVSMTGDRQRKGVMAPPWPADDEQVATPTQNAEEPVYRYAGVPSHMRPSVAAMGSTTTTYDVLMLLEQAASEAGGLVVQFSDVSGSRNNSFGLDSVGLPFLQASTTSQAPDGASLGSTSHCFPTVVEGDVLRAGRVLDALMMNVAASISRRRQGSSDAPAYSNVVLFHRARVFSNRKQANASQQQQQSGQLGSSSIIMWCEAMSTFTPTTIAALRLETPGSGVSFEHTREHGYVLKYRVASAPNAPVSLMRMSVPANEGDETVLIVHPSASIRIALAQWCWEHGMAACVRPALEFATDTNVATYAGVVLAHEMFLPGEVAEEIDMLTVFPFAYVCALSLAPTASAHAPPMDGLRVVLRGLPSHANIAQYRRFVMEVRLRAVTRYLTVPPALFHNPAPMRRLGQGSVGIVHKVRLEDGSVAAMKVMRSRLLMQNNIMPEECAEDERRKMTLAHPNIVNVHRVERTTTLGGGGGEVVVFSELCSDVTLRSLLQCGPLTHQEAAIITVQVLHGLDYLHRNLSYAGDLKTENILFGPLRRVKIADYASRFTTMHWRAPEFMASGPKTPLEREAADVWALGCVQLEMLFGFDFVPFAASFAQLPSHASAAVGDRDPSPVRGDTPSSAKQPALNPLEAARKHLRVASASNPSHVAQQLDSTLPAHIFPEWRAFILDCLDVDPHKRARVDFLLRHRFVNSVGIGFQQLPPMTEGHRAIIAEHRGDRGSRSQSSGGGGSSVNWPKAESGEYD